MDSLFLNSADEMGGLHIPDADLLMVLPFVTPEAAARAARIICARAAAPGLLVAVHDDRREGFVAVANRVFRASRSRLFGYVAEDAFPGRQWGRRVLQAFDEPETRLLAFNDGKWSGLLASFGVARRCWANENYGGNFFHPGYLGHYADVEITLLAMSDGGYRYDPNCVMLEIDYEKDRKKTHEQDKVLFAMRKEGGLGGRVGDRRLLDLFA